MPKRNIALPPVHNTRAPEQWRIISKHVDFDGKTVLDLGCGYGDLLWRAWMAGAESILGVEQNEEIQNAIHEVAQSFDTSAVAYFDKIDDFFQIAMDAPWYFDIAFCFSVLPYLKDRTAILRQIFSCSTTALIECQLAGDGPGFDWLKSPQDMRRWLESIGWKSVERIGETVVEDRGAKRGIWLCQ